MSAVVSASQSISTTFPSFQQSKPPKSRVYVNPLVSVSGPQLCSSNFNPGSLKLFSGGRLSYSSSSPARSLKCSSSVKPGSPGAGDNDNRSLLNAFFLGKALAEAVNERVESTVGEVLSTIGRIQAEQQKKVQGFQEEVLERAKRSKEKAAREAMEAQGLATKSTFTNTRPVTNAFTSATSFSTTNAATSATTKLDPANVDPVVVSDDE